MEKKYKVLVPTDFTTVADCAMEHAARIASTFDGEVYLLHVVGKKAEVEDTSKKIETIANEGLKKYNCKFNPIVRIGNIFEDIGDVATEIDARLIVMGTHGIKGIQHIIGSYALKVITNSKVPFVVVQRKTSSQGYKNIVLPVDSSQATKQKLAITANMAKHFKSNVHIYAQKENDEFLATKLSRELSFAKNYLSKRGVEHSVEISSERGNFPKQLIKFSSRINADLIAIVNESELSVFPGFFSGREQHILANEAEIPVMIMNPTQEFLSGSILFG